MNEKKAVEIMTRWLSHKNELGKKPARIKAAGSFSYDGGDYVILKFQPELFGQWQVGVVGFDEDGNECGHTFSEYEEYDEATAKDKCIAIIEYMKEYWKSRFQAELERLGMTEEEYFSMTEEERREKWDEAGKQGAVRVGSVLLKDANIDFDALCDTILAYYQEDVREEDITREEGILVFEMGGRYWFSLSLMEAPVPDGEAEFFAQGNFLWKEAVETTKQHQAHILVTVINRDGDPIKTACFFTDITDICGRETGALGIYTTGTVYKPDFYSEWAKKLQTSDFPIPLWVYLGLVQDENGTSGYTYGLTEFGRPEIEIIGSSHSPQEIYDFLFNVCDWQLTDGMYFHDGETLSFTSDQRLTITKSKAVYVTGESFKIGY